LPKILLSEKYCLYIGNDVFDVGISARKIRAYTVPYAVIGKGVYLLIRASRLGVQNVDYVTLAEVPKRIVGGTTRLDWNHAFERYIQKLEEPGLSLKGIP